MRIGFDAKRAFANKTGLGNYSRFVLDALLTNEKTQTYLAYAPKNKAELFTEFPGDNIRLPQTFLDKKLSAYWRYASITHQLKADGIDVFHGLSNELPQGLQKAGIKSVVTIHDLIFERLPHLFKPIDRLIYRNKFQSACRRADSIIAISEQTKRDLVALYHVDSQKIQVVYQDCNPIFKRQIAHSQKEEIRRIYDIQGPYILCVGTLEERKNQHRLVEAFANVASNDFQLILVGKPTRYTPKILEYIKKYNLETKVKILRDVPTAHLPALYQEAEIFAYISIYEGFGIPILEALHSGTPVLAAKGSCLEEAGGPGGLYADPYQKEDISHQLNKLITDAALRKRLVEAGKQHISQFSGENIARQLVDLYENLR
ncbi:glycosyltransferase family 4 protein [Dyadobacter fanqingshengii]|uniref:Glycosyltransferase family 4 protein n=1 Tax=Dyadobacter fanqingshengii TaxID=2906443 RepID=A0A9X1TB30_9BACT|nr:glycosyltransferase family 1 protein [Dyadobacter fanqingshengii]MCF0043142.1 glycosyltransferase family 4 protein [Dyadobacter fanqingshengii]MCF0043220.1 glycosyltransferase family 4 protein [Dyadobacter fanqingshengii]USJ35695.1 glycosyltransferase family 4 protein [Dyadobacter fanqingshengii]